MKTLLLALLVLLVMPSEAYELRTHANMTRFAQQASRLIVDSSIAADLGIEVDDSSSLSTYYYDMAGGVEERTTPRRTPKTFEFDRFPLGISETSVAGWLIRGTIREDDLDPFGCAANTIITWIHGREVEDFCNPQDDSYGNFNRVFKHFFDPKSQSGLDGTFNSAAPGWAMGVTDAFGAPNTPNTARRNHFSLIDARQAMLNALRGSDAQGIPLSKDQRNAYWATTFRALGDALHLVQDMAQPQHTRNELHPGSALEAYIEARAARKKEYRVDGTLVRELDPPPYLLGSPPVPTITRFSDVWSSGTNVPIQQRTGLADYSNRGFFTERRNFGNALYDLPGRTGYTATAVPDPDYQRLDALIEFLDAAVDDPLGPSSRIIHMTTRSTLSRFPTTEVTYSLNRFNFDDQAELLVPRGVAYSTALLDYFFRGRIDCVEDVTLVYGCRVRNLSNETMTGGFEVYYEAADGFMYPVPNAQWQTSIDLPPSDPNDLTVGEPLVFTEPSTPAPKARGHYVVVFHGSMGEEHADPDYVTSPGAVVAKQINLNSKGALYVLLASSFSGNLVTYRTDAEGTRPLRGNERDPFQEWALALRSFFVPGQLYKAPAQTYVTKQVVFGTTPNQYRTISMQVSTPFGNFTYFANPGSDMDYDKVPGYGWSAHSSDKSIGDFRFITTDNRNLSFARSYRENGAPRTATGAVSISFPTGLNGFGSTVVFGDGLRIGETKTFESTSATSSRTHYYDMRIALGGTPTAAFDEIAQDDSQNSDGTATTRDRTAFAIINGVRQTLDVLGVSTETLIGTTCDGTLLSHSVETSTFIAGSLTLTTDGTKTYTGCTESAQAVANGKAPLPPYLISDSTLQFTFDGLSNNVTFGSVTRPSFELVRDVSPIGEVFFATRDGAVIIHQPRNGRMPVFVKPAAFDQILGAIWM